MSKLNVAVIDDATLIRDLIKKSVRMTIPKSVIFEANNGKSGKDLLKRQDIDLILCDWEMPELNGEELLKWVRSQESYINTPFIMVTSRGDKENVIAAISAGVSDYLVKPFNNNQFKSKVLRAFKKHNKELPDLSEDLSRPDYGSASVLTEAFGTNKTSFSEQSNVKKKSTLPKGIGILRLPEGQLTCAVKQLKLTEMLGVAKVSEGIPSLLQPVAVDLEFGEGESKKVIRMNGFIQALKASDPTPETKTINIQVRFVDEDPEKMTLLSQYISQF